MHPTIQEYFDKYTARTDNGKRTRNDNLSQLFEEDQPEHVEPQQQRSYHSRHTEPVPQLQPRVQPGPSERWENAANDQDHLDFLRRKKDRENGELLGKLISETRGGVPRMAMAPEAHIAPSERPLLMPNFRNKDEDVYEDSKSPEYRERQEVSLLQLRNPNPTGKAPFEYKIKVNESWKVNADKRGGMRNEKPNNEGRLSLGKRDNTNFEKGGDLADLFGSDDGAEEDPGITLGRDTNPKDFLARQKEKTEMEKKLQKERQHEEMAMIVNKVTQEKRNEEVELQSEPDKDEEEALNSDDDVTGKIVR